MRPGLISQGSSLAQPHPGHGHLTGTRLIEVPKTIEVLSKPRRYYYEHYRQLPIANITQVNESSPGLTARTKRTAPCGKEAWNCTAVAGHTPSCCQPERGDGRAR